MARAVATEARLLPGDYARILSSGVLISYVLLVTFGLLFGAPLVPEKLMSGAGLLTASAFAAAACLAAWRVLPPAFNLPWLAFGSAAALATLSHTGQLLGDAASRTAVMHLFWAGGYALFLTGILLIVHQAEQKRPFELALDAALLVVAAAAVTLRWAPGLDLVDPAASPGALLLVVLGPVAAFCAALLVISLLAMPTSTLPRWSVFALVAATGCLVLASLPQFLIGDACCHADTTTTPAAVGMWIFLMAAGAAALRADVSRATAPHGERLRPWVAPFAAVVLGVLYLQTVLDPPVDRRTAYALALLALLVAARLTQLLRATRSQVAEQRELAQARALIEVNSALAGASDLDATLRILTESARRVLGAKAAAIELIAPDNQQLILRAASGMPHDMIGRTYRIEKSFTGWVVQNRDARVAATAAQDPLFEPESSALLGDDAVAAVPLLYRERVLGVLVCTSRRAFSDADVELLRAFANQGALAIEDARLFEQVRVLSITDALTGLANRRRLDGELDREFAAAQRGRRLVAVMFDLDDFKRHNDRYGHLAGDRALKHFADALKHETRTMNLAARYGGDEFFVLLGDADHAGATTFIERVRRRFASLMAESGNPVLGVSAGIAEFKRDMSTAAELVEAADRDLYMSKSETGTSK